jgi:hypothetical protein
MPWALWRHQTLGSYEVAISSAGSNTISCPFPPQFGGSLEVFSNSKLNKQVFWSSMLLVNPEVLLKSEPRVDDDDSRSTSIVVIVVKAKLRHNQFIQFHSDPSIHT